MIDLEKLRERVSGLPDSDGAIGPTWCKPSEALELLDYIAQLEKDAGRLDWLENQQEGHGFCSTGYGEYLYYVHRYNGARSVRDVIDTAMEAKHG